MASSTTSCGLEFRRFRRGVLCGIVALVLASQLTSAQTTPRSEQDRSDTTGASRHQLHLLYVVPKDGTDNGLDTDGTIAASAESALSWLQSAGGRTIRLDRFGAPQPQADITFVRLRHSEESIYRHPDPIGLIEWELTVRGILNSTKIYAAYYEGRFDSCAAARQPPAIGRLALLAIGDDRCRVGLLKPGVHPGEWELTLVHEVFHLLGAVGREARHATSDEDQFENGEGHVFDRRGEDLMSWKRWDTGQAKILDHGRDDYWEHNEAGLVDVSASLFMEPAKPNAGLPPGWPFQSMPDLPVASEPGLRSVGSRREASVQVVNASSKRLFQYWKDAGGVRREIAYLGPFRAHLSTGKKDDIWVLAEGMDRPAIAVWQAPAGISRAIYAP